jgi:hypothetical protein
MMNGGEGVRPTLVLALRVANLGAEIILLLEHIVPNAGQVGPLKISVEVDLDHAIRDGLLVLLLGAAGSAMEDEEDGLLVRAASLFRNAGQRGNVRSVAC